MLLATNKTKLAFILPAVLILLLFSIFPAVVSLALSFSNFSLSHADQLEFVGVANYMRVFSNPRFVRAVTNTLVYMFVGVGLQYVVGLGVALLLYRESRLSKFYRVAFLIPMMLTPVAIGYSWRMMFHETVGPLNYLLHLVGLPGVPWLSNGTVALLAVLLVDLWQWTPFMILSLLAGRMSISEEYYDAASVDGASWWQSFVYVTFPMLLPVSMTVILIRAIETAKIVDTIYVMTGGGPGTSTESLTLVGYVTGLKQFNLGIASAVAYTLLVMVMVFATAFVRIRRTIE